MNTLQAMFLFFCPAFFCLVFLPVRGAETRYGPDKKMEGGKIEKSLLPSSPLRHSPIVTDLTSFTTRANVQR